MAQSPKSLYLNLLAVAIGAGTLGSCSQPAMKGPQVQGLPEGFLLDANASAARLVFPDREKLDQSGYMTMSEENHCSVMITTYRGATSYEQATAARDAAQAAYPRETRSAVQATSIDGQSAWGWFEEQVYQGTMCSRSYTAVVSYDEDDLTHTVEFFARDPRYRDEEFLRTAVKKFRVVEKGRLNPAGVGTAALLGIGLVVGFTKLGRR